ncbi:MAG: hypothetical protein JWP12_2859 [Bacteroidetes bacterium]|nr:hypothetical protein [Bacteroidota bacterium]
MNYIAELTADRSRSNMDRIANAIGDDPAEFKKIIDIIYQEQQPLPHRASWLLTIISKKHPQLIKPYASKFIDTIERFNNDGIKRHMLRALTTQELPEKSKGKAITICFDFILSPTETVAVKVFALEVLSNLIKQYPELKNELKAAIEDQLPKTTAAFHSRAKKVLKKLSTKY